MYAILWADSLEPLLLINVINANMAHTHRHVRIPRFTALSELAPEKYPDENA